MKPRCRGGSGSHGSHVEAAALRSPATRAGYMKIIEEFKMIQQQNLNDINRMRDGKSPLTEEELKSERSKMINKRHEERLRDQIAKNKETSDK